MKVNRVVLTNYRLFKNLDTGPLPKLTFLCGPNSSGKSSLVSVITLLAQSIQSQRSPLESLVFNGELISMGTFRDMVYSHDDSREMSMCYWITPDDHFFGSRKNSIIAVRHVYQFDSETKQLHVKRVDLKIEGYKRWYSFRLDNEKLTLYYYRNYDEKSGLGDIGNIPLISLNVRKQVRAHNLQNYLWRHENASLDAKKSIAYNILAAFMTFAYQFNIPSNIVYIGPIRARPDRAFMRSEVEQRFVGVDGSNWVHIANTETNGPRIANELKRWLRKLKLANDLKWESYDNGFFSVLIQNEESGCWANIADTGQGLAQLLPILTQITMRSHGTFVFEQPELHLHPSAQAELGSMFAQFSKSQRIKLIIETHSDHILNRMRYEVVDGKVNSSDVAILYFHGDGKMQRIGINKSGQFVNAPQEFFETYPMESLKLFNKVIDKNA